ncbi:LacI family DNA-binding transcriptional regulator [Notoacmeibacter sp. MSK16QG-6]|uniref:LacI family DNA-binding transcriptional regulator n=1 Tax=Notoacmeibacter sp. MSK16QG-6 TaxID=2957982 RepID=UPI00209D26A7|nr:LacI family DNA-binding transcriptional regulator [Notoacmeibacter sp. MSK16QG-6]MCP1200464.1 LacI family transcriptional regulator [Notoacmeibacter sp. MSK16QG-6]
MAAKRRPTIIDVARQAGVSKSTAARVLSGGANVSPKVIEAVKLAVGELGYQRNNLAVSMRSGRSGLIGIVVPDISNPFWAEVVRGAQDASMKIKSSLLIFSSDWSLERERSHLQALVQTRVDGFLINAIGDDAEALDFANLGCPAVLLGTTADLYPGRSSVGSDIAHGVHAALDYLGQRGHGLPKLITGPQRRLARAKFVTAVNRYFIDRDIDPTEIEIEDGDYTVEGGKRAMGRFLAKARKGEHLTIFAANDLMALGAILQAREAGLDCPKDVSVMGFDGIVAGEFCVPPLTTVAKPARPIGEEAITVLDAVMSDTPDVLKRRLPCQLIERGSVKDLSKPIKLAKTG